MRHLWIGSLFVLAGCAGGHSVRVELTTDYVAGVDFVEVESRLRVADERTLGPVTRVVATGDVFMPAGSIGTFDEVPTGAHTLTVVLRGGDGRVVDSRETRVMVMGDQSVSVSIARGGADAGVDDAGADDAGADAGHDAGVDAGPDMVPFADFCPMWAAIFCEAQGRCCMAGGVMDCATTIENVCLSIIGLTATRTEIDYDAIAAATALAEARTLTATCEIELQDWIVARTGLFATVRGTRGGGELCTPRDTGDPIELTASTLSCPADQVCRNTGGEWRCLARSADGMTCTLGMDCASGRCERDAGMRQCGSGEDTGSPCGLPDECASFLCDGSMPLRVCAERTPDTVYCPR